MVEQVQKRVRYMSTVPCLRGHLGERYTSGNACVECMRTRVVKAHSRTQIGKNCHGCGKEFVTDRAVTNYCSRSCASNNRPSAVQNRRAKALASKQVEYSRIQVCERCTACYLPVNTASKYCSDECRHYHSLTRSMMSYLRRITVKTVDKTCRQCRNNYQRSYKTGATNSLFCSQRCCVKFAKHLRNRRLRAGVCERYSSVEVFQRDAYVCHICGEPTDPTQKFPHPLYPTVDHVRPLAKGGTDTLDNVKCAHFICNSYKSDSYQDDSSSTVQNGVPGLILPENSPCDRALSLKYAGANLAILEIRK